MPATNCMVFQMSKLKTSYILNDIHGSVTEYRGCWANKLPYFIVSNVDSNQQETSLIVIGIRNIPPEKQMNGFGSRYQKVAHQGYSDLLNGLIMQSSWNQKASYLQLIDLVHNLTLAPRGN